MANNTRVIMLVALGLFAFGAYAWSVIAVYVTLAGSEERALMVGDALEYAKTFGWHLIGPELPGASIGFWLGTIATAIALALSIGTSRQKF